VAPAAAHRAPPLASLALALCVALLAACAPRPAAGDRDLGGPTPGTTPVGAGAVAVATIAHLGTPVADVGATPRPSPGCSLAVPAPVPERLTVAGIERTFLTRLPDGPSDAPHDLVIAFHGRTNDAARARRYFHLDAALPDAVVVYPRALPAGTGTFAWNDPGDPPAELRDFALVEAIVDAFARGHCLDLDRVFVVGHSLGASFANDVACHLGARIRAVASVAGGIQGGPCVGGTAALLLHHPDDPLVPIATGERVRDAFLAANGLADAPARPADDPHLARLGCLRSGDDDAPHPVVWCPHDDATAPGGRHDPHTWPDGAAAAIASFFADVP